VEAARALAAPAASAAMHSKKILLGALLALGAVTPFQEFARAAVLPRWPINVHARFVDAVCGSYWPHYEARVDGQLIMRLLRPPHPLLSDPSAAAAAYACENPALEIERERAMR